MKYFTPKLYERLQNFDPAAMDAADTEWEAASAKYEQHLQELGPAVAPVLKRFESVLLHDAAVLGISRSGNEFAMVLLKDLPPRDVVTLTYLLTGEPLVDKNALAPKYRSQVMQYEYDEFDLAVENGQTNFTHSILFSNGWDIRLRFRDVQVTLAQPVYPQPGVSFPTMAASATA